MDAHAAHIRKQASDVSDVPPWAGEVSMSITYPSAQTRQQPACLLLTRNTHTTNGPNVKCLLERLPRLYRYGSTARYNPHITRLARCGRSPALGRGIRTFYAEPVYQYVTHILYPPCVRGSARSLVPRSYTPKMQRPTPPTVNRTPKTVLPTFGDGRVVPTLLYLSQFGRPYYPPTNGCLRSRIRQGSSSGP